MIKALIRRLPGVEPLVQSNLWRMYRHGVELRRGPRVNSNFTGFLRLPTQFEALCGPVMDVVGGNAAYRPLAIASLGCSNGAEAYTIASFLCQRYPGLDFTIRGFDIDEQIVEKARSGVYDPDTEVFNNRRMTDAFVNTTFDIDGGHYRIKAPLKERVSFDVADVLDLDALNRIGPMDVVYAQNFLFHLEPKDAERAFRNICSAMLRRKSVLFVDGIDLPLRQRLSRRLGLEPLDYEIEQIHNEARWARAEGWPYRYWGLEPFMASRRHWRYRYATILLRKQD